MVFLAQKGGLRPRKFHIAFRSRMSGERSLHCSFFSQQIHFVGIRCEFVLVQILYKKEKRPFPKKWSFSGAEGGIWTPARLNTAYSLSRGAPSASWVLLQAESMNIQLIARILYHRKCVLSRKTSRLFPTFAKKHGNCPCFSLAQPL